MAGWNFFHELEELEILFCLGIGLSLKWVWWKKVWINERTISISLMPFFLSVFQGIKLQRWYTEKGILQKEPGLESGSMFFRLRSMTLKKKGMKGLCWQMLRVGIGREGLAVFCSDRYFLRINPFEMIVCLLLLRIQRMLLWLEWSDTCSTLRSSPGNPRPD